MKPEPVLGSFRSPAFPHTVFLVVVWGAHPEVCWLTTRRVVAVMEHPEALGEIPIYKDPHEPIDAPIVFFAALSGAEIPIPPGQ